MKAVVVTDEAAGTAGMTLTERPEPPAAINDVVVEIHTSGFVPTELTWPSTWTDRAEALGYGAQEFADLLLDVIGGHVQKSSAALVRTGGTMVSVVGPGFDHEGARTAIVSSPSRRPDAETRVTTGPGKPGTKTVRCRVSSGDAAASGGRPAVTEEERTCRTTMARLRRR